MKQKIHFFIKCIQLLFIVQWIPHLFHFYDTYNTFDEFDDFDNEFNESKQKHNIILFNTLIFSLQLLCFHIMIILNNSILFSVIYVAIIHVINLFWFNDSYQFIDDNYQFIENSYQYIEEYITDERDAVFILKTMIMSSWITYIFCK